MNWKLIFLLAILGIAMAFAGVLGLRGRIEGLVWLVIFIFYAIIIVRNTAGKYFLHAFITCVINGIWIGIIHAAFISTYLANHRVIAGIYRTMPLSNHRRIMTMIAGLMTGLLMGVIAGLTTFAVGKITKKKGTAN